MTTTTKCPTKEPILGPGEVMLPASMRSQEYDRIREMVRACKPEETLEVGMANGGSTLVICQTLAELGRGRHTAIDPHQNSAKGWRGEGVARMRQAGLSEWYQLIENFDYLALPRLADQEKRFDLILIDGWHSFDYTLVDVFYADLLLNPGGILMIHDTGWPAVYKACRFLETHKPYDLVSPPPSVILNGLVPRLARRIGQALRGPNGLRQAHARRIEWFSMAAYRKRSDHQVSDNFFAAF